MNFYIFEILIEKKINFFFGFCFINRGASVVYLKSIISDIFTVYSHKQYPGSLPSTQLSRLISDQGIRLRLRKEPNRARR